MGLLRVGVEATLKWGIVNFIIDDGQTLSHADLTRMVRVRVDGLPVGIVDTDLVPRNFIELSQYGYRAEVVYAGNAGGCNISLVGDDDIGISTGVREGGRLVLDQLGLGVKLFAWRVNYIPSVRFTLVDQGQ